MLARIYYAPWDWFVEKTNARGRRAFGGWTLLAAVIGAIFFGDQVIYVTILSLIALIPNLTSETPVEEE